MGDIIDKMTILSFDVSTVSTGWSYLVETEVVAFGIITTNNKDSFSKRLSLFRNKIKEIYLKYKPTYVVIENNFATRNIVTLKALCRFSGVAMESCVTLLGIDPYIMNNKTVKKTYGVKTKEELYEIIIKEYKRYKRFKSFTFETHNDITDSIAQGLCYRGMLHSENFKKIFSDSE